MKKINSIWFGGILLKWGLIFLVAVPLLIYTLSSSFGRWFFFAVYAKISMVLGILIVLSLGIILVIELKQDKRINDSYRTIKNSCIKISDQYYECQNCGNKRVKIDDRFCLSCGMKVKIK